MSTDRDRYLDLLRALAIAVVVLGHWLMAVVWVEDGRLRASTLSDAPFARWIVPVLQIMPVFFLVGGVVNARSWRSAQGRGDGYGTWLRGRAVRLLRPAVPLVWFWALAAPALRAAGLDAGLVDLAMGNAFAPLWFLVVYPLVIAAVPLLLALHDRWGLRLVVALAAAAALFDALARVTGEPLAALPNLMIVWAGAIALGFCWGDGLLDRRAVRVGLAAGGAALLVAAVALLGYRVPEAVWTHLAPPTAALALLGWVQTAAVLALAAPVRRWLRRPRVWAGVVGLNVAAMPVYLWHLTVLLLVVGALWGTGLWPDIAPLSAAWWATRPLWCALLAACLVPVTAAVLRSEAVPPGAMTASAPTAVLAVGVAAGAVAAVVLQGATPLPALALTGAAAALGAWRRPAPARLLPV